MKKRILSLLLAVVMLIGLLPTVALADAEPASQSDVKYGAYVESEWTENNNGSSASTPDGNITVKKEAVKTGDNTYEIKLTVEMKQTASTVAAPAATVLVIDCSGSMKYCAECGNKNLHDNSCKYFNWESDAIQTEQTRLYAAKNAAKAFLSTYAGTDAAATRQLAIVGYGETSKTFFSWKNVAGGADKNSYNTAVRAIDQLYPGFVIGNATFKTDSGATNLQAGVQLAANLTAMSTVSAIKAKNVIVLTDGVPTMRLTSSANKTSTEYLGCHHVMALIPYWTTEDDVVGNGQIGSQTNNDNAKIAANSAKANAALYTVCFGAENSQCYDDGPTVGNFLREDIATAAQNNKQYAYNAKDADELNKAFANITQTIMEGIVAGTVTDLLPAAVSTTDPNFADSWELKPENARVVEDTDGSKTYIYTKTYTVTIDPEKVAEGTDYQPLNNETYLSYGENGKINFPIPAGKVTRPEITYTLIYNANDGSGAPANATFTDATGKTTSHEFGIAAGIPTREGYTFIGWTENQNGTGTVYGRGESQTTKITVSKAAPDNCTKTLYAQWTKNPTTANITITKTFTGEGLTEEQKNAAWEALSVTLTKQGAEGATPIDLTKDSTANGYQFQAVDLTEGTYTLTEENADIDGMKRTATLKQGNTVIEPNNGAWTITIGKDDINKELTYTLTNTYTDYTPAEVDLSALIQKSLTGTDLGTLNGAQKTFTVKLTPGHLANRAYNWEADEDKIITGTAVCGDKGETVSFRGFKEGTTELTQDSLFLTGDSSGHGAVGYYYLVEEVAPDVAVPGMDYDSHKYILKISVTRDAEHHCYTAATTIDTYDEVAGTEPTQLLAITFENEYTKPASTAQKHVITYERAIPEEIRKTLGHVDYPEVNNDKTQLVVDKSVDKITLAYAVSVKGGIGAYATVSDPGATYVGYAVDNEGAAIVTGGWGDGVMIQFLDDDTTVMLYYTKTFTRVNGKFPSPVSNTAIVNGGDVPSEETTITDKTPGGLDFSDIIWKDLYVTGDQNFPESLTFSAKLTLKEFTNDSSVMPSAYSLDAADPTVRDKSDTVVEAFPQGWNETLYATFNPDDVKFDKHNTKSFTAKDGSHLYLEFPAEGRYTFRVEEINGKADGVKYDSHVYEIVVYVLANGDGLYVSQITLFKITDGNNQVELGENVETITFYNEVDTGDIPYYPIIPILPTVKDEGKLNKTDHFAYIIGYPDGTVHPNGEITRAEVATIFFRLLKDDVRNAYFTSYNTYSDVKLGKWYNNPISTMSALGIINGYPDGTFRPNAPITRAEFAAIAARFDETATRGTTTFVDVYGHWAADEIAKAYGNDWIKGYPDGTFRPDRNITRAEAMTLINRVLDRAPESPADLLPDMNKWSDNMDTTKWYYLAIQEATNSHDYTRKTFDYEMWKRMLLDPDWSRYER